MKPPHLAAGRASRPNPSANPVGGLGKKGLRTYVKRIGARRAAVLRSLLCAVAGVGVVLAGPAAAQAAPSPSSVEAQIDKRLAPLELQVNLAMSQVGNMAGQAYMQGSPNAVKARPQDRRGDTVPIFKAPTVGNRNPREMEKNPSPEIKREATPGPILPRPTTAVPPTKTPPVQNNLLPKRQPSSPAFQQSAPAPVQNQPIIQGGTQRGQTPRQEKVFTPTVPTAPPPQIRPAPRTPTYQPSPPARSIPSRAPTVIAPPAPRAVAPQVVVPRTEAPQVQTRPAPAQTPQAPAQRPASNSGGNSRGKGQDNGNPRNNR